MTFAAGLDAAADWLRRKALARIDLEILVCGLESRALGLLQDLDNTTRDKVLRRIVNLNNRRVFLLRWQARLQCRGNQQQQE